MASNTKNLLRSSKKLSTTTTTSSSDLLSLSSKSSSSRKKSSTSAAQCLVLKRKENPKDNIENIAPIMESKYTNLAGQKTSIEPTTTKKENNEIANQENVSRKFSTLM